MNAATGGSGGGGSGGIGQHSELDEIYFKYINASYRFHQERAEVTERYSATDGSLDSVYKINTISPLIDPEV